MTSPADLSSRFNGNKTHDVGILLNEWEQEIHTITIDVAQVIASCAIKPIEPQQFSVACLIAAYTGPIVVCGSIKVLLFPLLPTINRRFPEEHASWIYYCIIKQIMKVLWQQPVKRKLLESIFYEEDDNDDTEDVDENLSNDDELLDDLLTDAIPKGTLEWLLLGIRIEALQPSE